MGFGTYAFLVCFFGVNMEIGHAIHSFNLVYFSVMGTFDSCTNLTSVTIGDSVTFIGGSVFTYCTNLTSIIVDKGNQTYQSISGNLYSKDGKLVYNNIFNT